MSRSPLPALGNLSVDVADNVIRISLLTQIEGRNCALFTVQEIPALIELLKRASTVATPEIPRPKQTDKEAMEALL